MDGVDLEVDPDELRAASALIERLVSSVASCHRAGEDAFGSFVLESAARRFRTTWARALDDLRDDLTQAAGRLRAAADGFERADDEAAAHLCLAPR